MTKLSLILNLHYNYLHAYNTKIILICYQRLKEIKHSIVCHAIMYLLAIGYSECEITSESLYKCMYMQHPDFATFSSRGYGWIGMYIHAYSRAHQKISS